MLVIAGHKINGPPEIMPLYKARTLTNKSRLLNPKIHELNEYLRCERVIFFCLNCPVAVRIEIQRTSTKPTTVVGKVVVVILVLVTRYLFEFEPHTYDTLGGIRVC